MSVFYEKLHVLKRYVLKRYETLDKNTESQLKMTRFSTGGRVNWRYTVYSDLQADKPLLKFSRSLGVNA
jgi:hypothetical protein